ncbi:hypothetical protein ACFY2W_10630 [Streptomyces sp. NPDC001262]
MRRLLYLALAAVLLGLTVSSCPAPPDTEPGGPPSSTSRAPQRP